MKDLTIERRRRTSPDGCCGDAIARSARSLRFVMLLAIALAFAHLLPAGPAEASVEGTAHENAIGAGGSCSACHVPHGALGTRLWPISMSSYETDYGVVGSLCYYCHGTGGGAGLPNAVQTFIMTPGSLSHGMDALSIPAGDSVDATLPYGTLSVLQCTTCHNVHDDTNKPFLRDDSDVLCARCHTGRQFVNGTESTAQGTWGASYYGLNNPGSHPMGTDVYNDRDTTADSPVNLTAAGVFTYAYGATRGHNLGGHLTDGGTTPQSGSGITCMTCHSVHGVQADSDPPSGGTAPVPNLLTIEQPTAGGAYGGSVYDGNGDPRNALCEGCHNDGTATTIDPSTGFAYSGAYNPNPGAQNYTHPCDNLGASGSAGVSSFPNDWPIGSSPGTNVSPGPICESCHTPHPNRNDQYRPTILNPSGNPILRATDICGQCHGGGAGGHHPAGVSMGSLSDSAVENGDGVLNCGDCHGGAQQSAHNWQQAGSFNLDPDWEPNTTGGTQYSDNGQTYEINTNKRFVPNSSKECMDCHLSAGPNPAPYAHHVTGSETEYGEYQDTGAASHYLGDTDAGALNYANGNCPDGTPFNAATTDWPGGGWSRFDSNGVNRVVCESCHEVQGSKNIPGTALLLHRYIEGDTDFTSTGYSYTSELCEGCHGINPGGKTHPMTGDIVDSTGVALDSTSNPRAANPPNGNATYPGSTTRDSMNCDGCHQPHDADTNGGAYILEDNVTGTASGNTRGASIPDLRYSSFCKECHTSY